MSKKYTTEEFIERARKVHGNQYDYSKVEYINSATKVCIICPKHGQFKQLPSEHLRGSGCPQCHGTRKYTLEEFLIKAKAIHGDRYDYSKVTYKNRDTKVCIICREHGEFWQTPCMHLKGQGCPKCANNILSTTEIFIQKAIEKHGNKYDYSKVNYINNRTKVCIRCPVHGEFWQKPNHHLQGQGCPKCGIINIQQALTMSTEEFIEKATKVHGNKYDYSKVDYINSATKVCIVCPKHGEFYQLPSDHIYGYGCLKCGQEARSEKRRLTLDDFIKRARKVHGNKYDYSKTQYVNNSTKICIICPIHGEFWQLPRDHLRGYGCKKCGIESSQAKRTLSQEEFIRKSKEIHGIKYDYTKVEYTNNRTKVCIICPIHGEFYQEPSTHLNGCGCPKCNSSKLENEIRNLLTEEGVEFEEQKRFKWLKTQSLDFYIPQYKTAVECQGIQHFESNEHFGGDMAFIRRRTLDNRKQKLCIQNGIKILYYSNLNIKYPYKVYENKEELKIAIYE